MLTLGEKPNSVAAMMEHEIRASMERLRAAMGSIEQTLARRLMAVARVYAAAAGNKLSSVGQKIAGDGKFFLNIEAGKSRFSARSYDDVMRRFSAAWPEGAVWPLGVPRPDPEGGGSGKRTAEGLGVGAMGHRARRAG